MARAIIHAVGAYVAAAIFTQSAVAVAVATVAAFALTIHVQRRNRAIEADDD